MNTLTGIEIFAAGVHNGDEYTEADLDEMQANFARLDYRPPLKAGHVEDRKGMPALGWVDNVRRVGSKLIADFVDLPDLVYSAIKDKRYNTVSSEIYWNLKRGGEQFRRALKAVALLGAEIPAVAGLRPLHEMFGAEGEVHFAHEQPLEYELKLSQAKGIWSKYAGMEHPHAACYADFRDKVSDAHAFCARVEKMAAGTTPRERAAKKTGVHTQENGMEDKIDALQAQLEAEKEQRERVEGQLKEFEAQLAKVVKAKRGSELDDALASIKDGEAQAQVKALSQKVDALQARADAERAAREAAEQAAAEKAERIAKLEEESRADRVARLAESCRIPAMRPFIKQFLDLATRQSDTKVYDMAGQSIGAVDAVQQAIKYINDNAAHVFSVISREDGVDKEHGDDVAQVVDRKARKYALEHKVEYSQAVRAVLNEDPALKHEYALGRHRMAG